MVKEHYTHTDSMKLVSVILDSFLESNLDISIKSPLKFLSCPSSITLDFSFRLACMAARLPRSRLVNDVLAVSLNNVASFFGALIQR